MTAHRPARIVVVAPENPVGLCIAQALATQAEVHLLVSTDGPAITWQGTAQLAFQPAQVLRLSDVEVALAGADVVLFLPGPKPHNARLVQASAALVRYACLDTLKRALSSSSIKVLVSGSTDSQMLKAETFEGKVVEMNDAQVHESESWIVAVKRVLDLSVGEFTQPPSVALDRPLARLDVLSIQRFEAPAIDTGEALAQSYFTWLRKRIFGLTVKQVDGVTALRQFGVKFMSLRAVHAGASSETQVYVAEDGWLLQKDSLAHFEFRVSPASREALVILHGFEPALPFWLYRLTQAQVHQFSMNWFAKSLVAGAAR